MNLEDFIGRMFEMPGLTRMGHNQRTEDGNLGLGWLYYALGRLVRPRRAVVIGSYRGFVPLVLGRALADNTEPAELTFIDPSLVDDFWADPDAVREHFAGFGLSNVRHFRATTQEFVETGAYRELGPIGLLFVDGLHTKEQAEYDWRAFEDRLEPQGFALFHDSMLVRNSTIYGADRPYVTTVRGWIDEMKQDPALQVFDVPFGGGLTLVRKLGPGADTPRNEAPEGRP